MLFMNWKESKITPAISLIFSWAFVAVFVIPLCGALFGCGCTWIWAGGASGCVGMMDHHGMHHTCPWCVDGQAGFIIPVAAIFIAQTGAIIFLWWKYRAHILAQMAAGIVAFLAAAYVESIFHAWFKNYHF